MAALQYIIDSICANFTVASMYDVVKLRLSLGPCTVDEIAHEVRCEDRTLDFSSSKILAEAALEAMVLRGDIRIEGDHIFPKA